MKMIFKNNDEKIMTEKFLNRHLLEFIKFANMYNWDLSEGKIPYSSIFNFTSVWLEGESEIIQRI